MGKAEDRISNLPESLLHHILSFLPIKVVARTCVLSHRWKYIWTSIPNLEFEWDKSTQPTYLNIEKFTNFVDGTLHRHSLTNYIHKFYLRSSYHLNEFRVNSWISSVMRHNPKELSLFLRQAVPLFVPLSVFTCASLITLELETHPNIRFPNYIAFPQLKCLRLCNIDLSTERWNDKLFSNSPVLEELYLESCMFLMPNFCISIPTLKNLKINDAVCGAQNCAFEICAPSLLTLFYKGFVAKEYVLSSFVALVEAVVCFCGELEARSIDGAVSQFFGALTHVKCLTVDYPSRQAKNLLNRLPTYPNIKQLKITGIPNYSDVVVIALLKVTPNLESLVMEKWESAFLELPDYETDDSFDSEGEENQDNEDEGSSSEDGSDEGVDNHVSIEDGWTSLVDMVATGGLFLHLKSVSFKPIIWSPREKLCVKVILRKAKALQSLTICHDYSRHPLNWTEQDLMKQIVSFPRASASCRFKICSE